MEDIDQEHFDIARSLFQLETGDFDMSIEDMRYKFTASCHALIDKHFEKDSAIAKEFYELLTNIPKCKYVVTFQVKKKEDE